MTRAPRLRDHASAWDGTARYRAEECMPGTKVLVIDDSSAVRQEVTLALEQAGFEVVTAVDGTDAWAKLAAVPKFGAVVTDLNMPRMGGLELLARIQSDPNHAGLPVVVLTTEGDPALIRQAKSAGAKGWMVKPFKPELLAALVRKVARK